MSWPDLGAWVERRVDELDLTWADVYRRSGVSETTVAKIRRGEAIQRGDKLAALISFLEDPRAFRRPLSGAASYVGTSEVDGVDGLRLPDGSFVRYEARKPSSDPIRHLQELIDRVDERLARLERRLEERCDAIEESGDDRFGVVEGRLDALEEREG